MNKMLSFNDVLLAPKFSTVRSRKNVDTSINFLGLSLKTPILSSNMDTVTNAHMANTLIDNGAMGVLHRFCSIEENVQMFNDTQKRAIVSFGVGDKEHERLIALREAGATHYLLDVAHAAAIHVVDAYDAARDALPTSCYIIVGNFATKEAIKDFEFHVKSIRPPDAYKVGIGGGSLCTTRIVTGCGLPTLASVLDCSDIRVPIIADGGIKTSGDVAKVLAAGASMVMLGGMFAGTEESAGESIFDIPDHLMTSEMYDEIKQLVINGIRGNELMKIICMKYNIPAVSKKYRGSASRSSYDTQGKTQEYISPEGEETLVPYKGSVVPILKQIEGGLRSAMSYCNAENLKIFRENAKMVEITQNGYKESEAHGKN